MEIKPIDGSFAREVVGVQLWNGLSADQLEQAKTVIAQPIPQDIINTWKELAEAPVYEIPRCPKCKALDAILESVEPSNRWLCESCGYTWSEPVLDPATGAEK